MLKNLMLISFLFTGIFSLTIHLNSLAYAQNSPISGNSEISKNFNIAVASDWGCNGDAQKTANNIQSKNPELVIAGGDLSYKGTGTCWTDIIAPFESKTIVSMGDHEYHDTDGGKTGVVNDYLKPLGIKNSYYSFNINNAHLIAMDPYLPYDPNSAQYKFVVNDLKNANNNPNIEWILVIEHIPFYTSPSKHPADTTIRDTFHPLFDKYNVDLVFSGDNHNYQRTYPLTFNTQDSSTPIISKKDSNNYKDDKSGVIYIITGTAGRSHYDITQKAPFVATQDDTQFGFLNIDIRGDQALIGTFYENEKGAGYHPVANTKQSGNILDQFTISKNVISGSQS